MENNKIMEEIESKITGIIDEGINMSNLDTLGKLIDMHKDLCNESYWKVKKEVYNNELQEIRRR